MILKPVETKHICIWYGHCYSWSGVDIRI